MVCVGFTVGTVFSRLRYELLYSIDGTFKDDIILTVVISIYTSEYN